ncbi:MAG: ion channel [Snowella sp.]|nr:ion channel [Snowella sp.]
MLKRWTNPYIILILTVIGITIAIVGKNTFELFFVNVTFLITISLIALRNFYLHDRVYSDKNLQIFLVLVLVGFFCDLMAHFHWLPDFNKLFLAAATSIKILVFGYEWLATVKILAYRQKVTSQTIVLAIISYLFIGIIWSFIYFFIWQIDPHSFKISDLREYEFQPWNLAMYFSLITLTTVGYGGIIPIGRWVMVLVNFEAMAGAIYLTVIVARLVSLYGNSE